MKKLLTYVKQLNKSKRRKGSALVTVICVTSIAIILILALYSLTSFALNKSIREVGEQQALYNAESIAKMISDDITSGKKSKFMTMLTTLKESDDESEIVYNMNNDKLGNTKVTFKREKDRPKNIIMRVNTDLHGYQGNVKVRFLLKQEGDNTEATLKEVEKIFNNTVYSGGFPSGSASTLQFVDFAGDIVIKLEKSESIGNSEDGALYFGGNDSSEGTTSWHNGNVIVLIGAGNTLKIHENTGISGNIICDGNVYLYNRATKIGGSIIAKGDITLGGDGRFNTIGAANIDGDIAMISGGNISIDAGGSSPIQGNIYAKKSISVKNTLQVNGMMYIDDVYTKVNFNWSSTTLKNNTTGTTLTTQEAATAYNQGYIKQKGQWQFKDETGKTLTIDEKIDSLINTVYSSTPVPMWYAPDDYDDVRSDNQSIPVVAGGTPSSTETWHNFNGVSEQISNKYSGVDLSIPAFTMTGGVSDSKYDYSWTPSESGASGSYVKTINHSGYVSNDMLKQASNSKAKWQSLNDGIVSFYQNTLVLDATDRSLHLKLTDNVTLDNTDVVILGKNFVYFYIEEFTLNVGRNDIDNKFKSDAECFAAGTEMDKLIHFGVNIENNRRVYNNDKTNLSAPHVFLISSYGEQETVVTNAGGIFSSAKGKIYPFLCINNNACVYAYLYAPYRPVVMSESYVQGSSVINAAGLSKSKTSPYKFMGSLCVNRIDDYKTATGAASNPTDDGGPFGLILFKGYKNGSYRRMYYFNPTETKGAFNGIIFNKECLATTPPDESGTDDTLANPIDDAWTIEAFL